MNEKGTGKRYNAGKLRYDLINPLATEGLARVLTHGSQKYGERNWENGMPWSKVTASLERHFAEIQKGNDYDEESGELHVDHLQCNIHFLATYYRTYPQGDDRAHAYLSHSRIGLDIDDVLADFTGAWSERFNMNIPTSWCFDRKFEERIEELVKNNELESFFLGLRPLIDSTDIPFEPHCYITSRHIDTNITEKWLDINGFPSVPVYTVPPNTSKVDTAKQADVEIFVDDKFTNFKELNSNGICCYLLDKPHNRRYDVGFKRIKSLTELKNK